MNCLVEYFIYNLSNGKCLPKSRLFRSTEWYMFNGWVRISQIIVTYGIVKNYTVPSTNYIFGVAGLGYVTFLFHVHVLGLSEAPRPFYTRLHHDNGLSFCCQDTIYYPVEASCTITVCGLLGDTDRTGQTWTLPVDDSKNPAKPRWRPDHHTTPGRDWAATLF